MQPKFLAFVIVFILIFMVGFAFGPKWIKRNDAEPKTPLNLEYDVNLPNLEKPAIVDKKTPSVAEKDNNPVPDLNRPIVIYSDLPEETKVLAREKIIAITYKIQNETAFFDDWVELGNYRKLIGDHNSALEIWLYASGLSPASSVSFNNIANLYSGYLHDYQKAEEYYLKAIKAAPSHIYGYFAAFEFYKSVLKDDKKAEDIVRQGIVALPQAKAELEALLAP